MEQCSRFKEGVIFLVNKIEAKKTYTFKPEIMECPFCGGHLSYRYTLSNKVIQFSDGSYIRVKNLGYGCNHCSHDSIVYSSATASKMCIKGYTYSRRVIDMIYYYKEKHYSRDAICDVLWGQGLEISDRNVDAIYNKYYKVFDVDYDSILEMNYEQMMKEFQEIRISIDFIRVEDTRFIHIRNYFTNEQIGNFVVGEITDPKIYTILSKYLDNKYLITYVITIRPMFDFYKIIKNIAPETTNIISYYKY